MWKCPECGCKDLMVDITSQAYLTQEADGTVNTEITGLHNWAGASPMYCRQCDYTSKASDFKSMQTYVVTWQIDCDAESALDAARKVAETCFQQRISAGEEDSSCVFYVSDAFAPRVRIDLSDYRKG